MYCNYLLVREHDGDAVVQRVDVDHVAVAVVLLRQDVEHVLQVGKSVLACTCSMGDRVVKDHFLKDLDERSK